MQLQTFGKCFTVRVSSRDKFWVGGVGGWGIIGECAKYDAAC